MTEAKLSNCLLATIILLTITMLIWTVNLISNTNQVQTPIVTSAFSA